MDMRTARNIRRHKKQGIAMPFKIIAFILAVSVGAAGLSVIVNNIINYEYFSVKRFYIEGNNNLVSKEVIELLGVKGKSIFMVDKDELNDRLLRSPWIKKAYLRKEFPHTISVSISETLPVALNVIDGKMYLIDKAGKRLKTVRNILPGLPVIKIDPKKRRTYEESIKLSIAVSKKTEIDAGSVEIKGSKPEDISMNIAGTMVLVGYGNYDKKLANYLNLEDEINRRSISVEYIDVRFANRLIVKQTKGES